MAPGDEKSFRMIIAQKREGETLKGVKNYWNCFDALSEWKIKSIKASMLIRDANPCYKIIWVH